MHPQSPWPFSQWSGCDLGVDMHSYLWLTLLAEGTTGALLKVLSLEGYPSPCPSRLSRSGLDWCSCPLLAWVVGRILNVPFKIPVFWLFNQSLTWELLWWVFFFFNEKWVLFLWHWNKNKQNSSISTLRWKQCLNFLSNKMYSKRKYVSWRFQSTGES